ncbi:hypothetical protein OESDEN_02682 [Oesophagostomum dentatum]|uniref:Reverse transcriptase domain-containing protein n=1 Tax=Oesophagostomum dentatum TaxID=61180 RepID=A0A0B1TIF6_OESDE|nr:hypothetical protein OESDEN_02682 [Oesophagostomum dentatum]
MEEPWGIGDHIVSSSHRQRGMVTGATLIAYSERHKDVDDADLPTRTRSQIDTVHVSDRDEISNRSDSALVPSKSDPQIENGTSCAKKSEAEIEMMKLETNAGKSMGDQNLSVNIRPTIFNSVVPPAMLYACETWATTKSDEEKFAVTERATERRICGATIRDKLKEDGLDTSPDSGTTAGPRGEQADYPGTINDLRGDQEQDRTSQW